MISFSKKWPGEWPTDSVTSGICNDYKQRTLIHNSQACWMISLASLILLSSQAARSWLAWFLRSLTSNGLDEVGFGGGARVENSLDYGWV